MDVARIKELIQETNKKHGDGAVYTLGSKFEIPDIPRWSSGLSQLDYILGGGVPKGRIGEIYGPEGSGKTTLAYHLCAQCQLAIFIDMEGTFDSTLAKTHGNRKNQLLVRRPDWGEQALEIALEFIKAGCPLVFIDSVPTLTPHKEFEGKKGMEGSEGVAMVANLLSRKLPVLQRHCEISGSSLIFINQIRDNMQATPFGDKTRTPGGRMLKHVCSFRIHITRRSWIKNSNYNVGQLCKLRVVKSKICPPYREAEIPLIFTHGFFQDMKDPLLNPARRASAKLAKADGNALPAYDDANADYDEENDSEETND